MSMKFEDFKDLAQEFETLAYDYENFLRQFLLQMGLRALGQAKSLTPRDLGAGGGLISKWELSDVQRVGDELYIEVFNSAEYASFVEDGHMQHKRFLPLRYLDKSPHGRQLAAELKAKYGPDTEGVMLQEKWIPGFHMAKISINKIEKELPRRFQKAFEAFLKSKGL